jgi:hypothetical protein
LSAAKGVEAKCNECCTSPPRGTKALRRTKKKKMRGL